MLHRFFHPICLDPDAMGTGRSGDMGQMLPGAEQIAGVVNANGLGVL